jgi:hypothetical protein
MKQPIYNDQAHIAEQCLMLDDHITQTARLAFFKISSYKLSLVNASFCMSREEFTSILKSSLLNYTNPAIILADLGFFGSETEN